MTVAGHYTLIGQTAVPEDDLLTWARWFEEADRRVMQTKLGPFWVSTVFLGMDHGWGRGRPVLFETMIFFLGDGFWQDRCSSWEEAEILHGCACMQVRAALKRPWRIVPLLPGGLKHWMMDWDRRLYGRYGKTPFREELAALGIGLPPSPPV
jgi:hypothetical protein